ncbi:hypothetical protein P3T23_003549 [Paraburkholderia sp. GAS448]
MPTMEVDVFDGVITANPGAQSWSWQAFSWEYIGLTIIPISSNGSVQITSQGVSSDPNGTRTLFFDTQNNTNDNLSCFVTLTLPHDSVD